MKLTEGFSSILKKGLIRAKIIGKDSSGNDVFALFNDDGSLFKQYDDADTPTPPLKIGLIGGRVPGGEVKVIDVLQDLLGYYLATKSPKSIENSVSLLSGTTLNGGDCLNTTPQNTYQSGLRQVWVEIQSLNWNGTPVIKAELQIASSNNTLDTNWTTIKSVDISEHDQVYAAQLNEDDLFKFFRLHICDTGSSTSSDIYATYYPVQ